MSREQAQREKARRRKARQTSAVATQQRRRPFDRPRPGEDIQVAFVPGVTVDDETELAAMRERLHDSLIDMLGRRRRSGIRWRHAVGRDEAERILALMYEGDPKWEQIVEHYFPFLAEHGDSAVLVVAECEAVAS